LRFNGDFRNSNDSSSALRTLETSRPDLAELIQREAMQLEQLFRDTFHHHRFTGRSGTFFAYEGLGSVYWHMVSKLLLAVADVHVAASQAGVARSVLDDLRNHFREIREGLGVSSLPGKWGAFPIDPYSHTPKHSGAQQPGMTGQVKEDVLSRLVEVGVRVNQGVISFDPSMFESAELLQSTTRLNTFGVDGQPVEITVPSGSFVFSFCQVPIVVSKGRTPQIRIHARGLEKPVERSGLSLTLLESASIFDRDHLIERIDIVFS
jgi:hypothetical protein